EVCGSTIMDPALECECDKELEVETMRQKTALWGTAVAGLVTVANLAHGVAHAEQQVPLAAWQWVYVIFVIFLAPIAAAILLWTRFRQVGAWLFVASMAGSFVFGLAYHFLVPGADNVFVLHPGAWWLTFQLSAGLVALADGIGCLVGIQLLNRFSHSSAEVARTASVPAGSRRGPRLGPR
ncbi:MAG: hypothetical protein ACR2GU_11125, partial [Rubrobacteraceae bacterium]